MGASFNADYGLKLYEAAAYDWDLLERAILYIREHWNIISIEPKHIQAAISEITQQDSEQAAA